MPARLYAFDSSVGARRASAPPIASTPASAQRVDLVTARVIGQSAAGFQLDLAESAYAIPAVSCLLEPAVGDTVLVTWPQALDAGAASAIGHITAILARPGSDAGRLNLPGGAHIASQDGALQLHARRADVHAQALGLHAANMKLQGGAIALGAKERLALDSAELDVNAAQAQTRIGQWNLWSDQIEACALSIRYTARNVSAHVGRLMTRALESLRLIKGLDDTQAGRSRTTVDDQHQVRAGHITARARGFVKIDGQKIDLG